MTSTMITASAQWALEGKKPDGEDYHILSCSTGALNRGHFADALSRFQLGELTDLPQVSVSYARLRMQPALNYLAMAIHWYAIEGQRHADGVEERDDQARPTTYTSYFCLPYAQLAESGVGYVAMYEALHVVRLAVADGPPQDVKIAVSAPRISTASNLAIRVAPLLLTGRPVCVLGADGTSLRERLEFIDTVMQYLPYGFRSRMTAATWTRATNRQHGFRLFFSNAPRVGTPGRAAVKDWVVTWGADPEVSDVLHGPTSEYLDWLQGNVGPLARLACLTDERGFGPKDLTKGIEVVTGTKHRFPFPPTRPLTTGKPRAHQSTTHSMLDTTLRDCARYMHPPNISRLRSEASFLRKLADAGFDEERHQHYRSLIKELGLLQHGFFEGDTSKYAEKLYDALIRMAFDPPLDYGAYCWVEHATGITDDDAPHPELLMAIVKAGASEPASAIAYWYLGKTDAQKSLNKWLVSGKVDVVTLIDYLADPRRQPKHARMVCEVTIEYLKKAHRYYQPQLVRDALRRHGFLAHALQLRYPDKEQFQVYALHHFLRAAYPQAASTPGQDLSKQAIVQVLSGTDARPTPALLGAVLMLLHKPEARQLAWYSYVRGSVVALHLDDATQAMMRDRLPPPADAAAMSATEPLPVMGPAPSDGDITEWLPTKSAP